MARNIEISIFIFDPKSIGQKYILIFPSIFFQNALLKNKVLKIARIGEKY